MPACNELDNVEGPDEEENPFFCLLEDDKFITSLSVESDSLLSSEKITVTTLKSLSR